MKDAAIIVETKSVISDSLSDSSIDSSKRGPTLSTKPTKSSSSPFTSQQQQQQQQQQQHAEDDHLPEFDAPILADSPAPIPEKGGDYDFIQVNAVRKIKVAALPPSNPNDHKPKFTSPSALCRKPAPSTLNSKIKKKDSKNPNRESMAVLGSYRKDEDDLYSDSSDDDFKSDSEQMDTIEKSPYEVDLDAEKGEALFEKMKLVLKGVKKNGNFTNTSHNSAHKEAARIFGLSNALCLVKAYALIEKSGMVYSQEWTEGVIRGEKIGAPKELILLCLVSNRLAKQQDQLLSGLTRDFEVSSIIAEALDSWELSSKYPKVMAVTKNYQFVKRRRDCYKAAIFVARAWGCYKTFVHNHESLEPRLNKKIITCLDMMEENLRGDAPKKKYATTITSEEPTVKEELTFEPMPPQKRKRGRPKKNSLPQDAKANGKSNEILFDKEAEGVASSSKKKKKRESASKASRRGALAEGSDADSDDENNMYPYNPPSRGKAKTNLKSASIESPSKTVTSSLPNLLVRFEEQYHEMGRVYQSMGQTLRELKSKIQENRTATEEELRAEILQEVQESLLKSFGKP